MLAAFLLLAILFWLTLVFLNQYARHGQSQTVPNLIGISVNEANEMLENLNLELALMDSTYTPEEKPYTVLNQDPPAGSKVKSGRKIYLTINTANPPLTEIPGIELGTSYVSVKEVLSSKGILVGNITYKPFEYKDVFLDMMLHGEEKSVKPGTKVPKGSKVDIVLGNGLGDTKVLLPDLRTLTYEEAVNLIQLKELNLGAVVADGLISDTAAAYVFRQSPSYEPGKKINIGSMIDIWISQDERNPFEDNIQE